MKNIFLQKSIPVLVLAILILALIVVPVAQPSAQAQVDVSQQNQRSIDELVNSLSGSRCSGIGKIISLKLNCIILDVVWLVDKFLASTFLAAATYIFDLSISYSLKDIASSLFVSIGWGIVRDITNLFFIFILLWIALATIFDIPGYGYKDLLRQLIVAALLINFSLAIGGFIINFTNALGKSFLSAPSMKGSCLVGTELSCGISNKLLAFSKVHVATTQPLSAQQKEAICEKVSQCAPGDDLCIENVQYEKCINTPGFAEGIAALQKGDKAIEAAIYQALWLIIIIPILSFVFFAAAIFFLSRYLMLSILLVFAPIVFLFMILPDTRGLWNRWWNSLIQWSFFAPAFFFLLFLTVEGFEQLTVANVGQGAGVKGFFGIGFDMILIIVLMIINLFIAQQMGIYGAGMVIGWGSRAAGWVQGAARRGAIRGLAPAAEQFAKTPVGQFMARTPGLRALAQPAVAIQKERERLDTERAERVLGAIRTAPAEFGAQRLAGESRSVQEAVYKSARPEDIERIMKGFTKETKDAAGNVIVDKSAAEKEIIKIRNRDPKLAEKIESSVKDLHLKVVASKGVGLGSLTEGERAILRGEAAGPPTPAMANFQKATNEYLNDQSEQKLKTILTPENIKLEQAENYMFNNFGAREAKSLAKTTEQFRAFTETMMKAVEKQNKAAFRAKMQEHKDRHLAATGEELSDARARFFAFRDMAPQAVQNPSLQRWISSAPALNMMYRGVPMREREFPFVPAGGGTPPPAAGGGAPT